MPASVVLNSPPVAPVCVRGLPPENVSRRTGHAAAYSVSGSAGSICTSTNPVLLSMNLLFSHVLPPSVVLNSPRSAFGPQKCPTAATYAMSGFFGCTAMRPMWCVSFSPHAVHVLPPSVVL